MSQTEMPIPGRRTGSGNDSASGNGAGPASGVRWIVLFTGSKATEDYQPWASAGESAALVKEVTEVCVAFHPHSEIRLFPSDRDVLLYWKAQSTGDWIVTRVEQAPNPQGVRTALEYISIPLSPAQMAQIAWNPYRIIDLDIFDRVREQFLAKRQDPLPAALSAGTPSSAATTAAGPEISSDRIATAENDQALRAYYGSGLQSPPPAFASWWASGGQVPAGRFDIVLKAEPPKVLTLRDAGEVAGTLAAEMKASLPNAPASDAVAVEMSRGLLTGADAIASGIAGAASRINDESQDQFRERLAEAARVSSRVAADLNSYGQRLNLPPAGDGGRLTDWAERYQSLARELPRVRHPNPFAARTGPSPAAAVSTGSRTQASAPAGNSGMKIGIGAAAVAVLALIGFVATQMGGKKGTPPPSTVSSPAGESSPAPNAQASTAPASSNSDSSALASGQDAALSAAKMQAHDTAKAAAAKTDLDEKSVEKIVFAASKAAYKATLPPDQFQKTFSGETPWTYARLKEAAPSLVPAVHEAAMMGAMEAKSSRTAAAAAKAATAAATPAPQPSVRVVHEEPTPEPPKKHVAEATPKPAPKPPAAAKSAPAKTTGTADQTGL